MAYPLYILVAVGMVACETVAREYLFYAYMRCNILFDLDEAKCDRSVAALTLRSSPVA